MFDTYDKIKACVKHIKSYSTILRHFDLTEVSKFIIYMNKHQKDLNHASLQPKIFN